MTDTFLGEYMIRLAVQLKDGRTLSGQYDWLSAMARIEFAKDLPNFAGFYFTGSDESE